MLLSVMLELSQGRSCSQGPPGRLAISRSGIFVEARLRWTNPFSLAVFHRPLAGLLGKNGYRPTAPNAWGTLRSLRLAQTIEKLGEPRGGRRKRRSRPSRDSLLCFLKDTSRRRHLEGGKETGSKPLVSNVLLALAAKVLVPWNASRMIPDNPFNPFLMSVAGV